MSNFYKVTKLVRAKDADAGAPWIIPTVREETAAKDHVVTNRVFESKAAAVKACRLNYAAAKRENDRKYIIETIPSKKIVEFEITEVSK